eukprot:gene25029-389_t
MTFQQACSDDRTIQLESGLNVLDVAVIGAAGMMGSLISAELALYGHNVMMYDVAGPAALTDAVTNIEDMYRVLVEDGYYTNPEVEAATSKLRFSESLREAVATADFVSECIVENLAIKRRVFLEASQHCPAEAVLSTNSMTLSCTDIAAGCVRPERIMGVRF